MAGPEADLPDVPGDRPRSVDRLLTAPDAVVHAVEAFGGGVLDVVVALANATAERGWRCSIVYGRRPETPRDLSGLLDSRVRLVEVPGWGSRRRVSYLPEAARAAAILRRELPPHVAGALHLHSSIAGVVGRAFAAPRSWSTFYSPHAYAFLNESLPAPVRALARGLERTLGKRGTTIAVSRAEAAVAAALVGNRRVVLIHNGIEVPPQPPPPRSGVFTVACIGRASFQRRPDLVARVAARVQRQIPSRFVWIGDGPGRGVLGDAGIRVEGWLPAETARARLADADAVLHLAAFDGFPVGVLEAMAAARVVVATDIPPLREAIGPAGVLVRDDGDAADALVRLATEDTRRERLGAMARERVVQRFSRSMMVERTLAAYTIRPSAAG